LVEARLRGGVEEAVEELEEGRGEQRIIVFCRMDLRVGHTYVDADGDPFGLFCQNAESQCQGFGIIAPGRDCK